MNLWKQTRRSLDVSIKSYGPKRKWAVIFTFHYHFEGKSVPWTLKSRVFQVSALTSRALKNFSTSSKGATSVLETLVRIIWICEIKREGLLTSQSKVMVQNVSERSFFTFHYHFEGKFDVDKKWAITHFWVCFSTLPANRKLSRHFQHMLWVSKMFFHHRTSRRTKNHRHNNEKKSIIHPKS